MNKYGEIPLLIIVDQLEESGIISHQLDRAGCFGFIFYDAGEYHVVTSFGNHRFSTFKIEPGLLGYPQDIDEKKFCLYSLESLCLYAVQKETSLLKTSDLVRKMIKSRSFKFF